MGNSLASLLVRAVAAAAWVAASSAHAQESQPLRRGAELVGPVEYKSPYGKAGDPGADIVLYRESWAVVIGIDSYTNMPVLGGAVRDAEAIAETLQAQGFNVRKLINGQATRKAVARLIADELPRAVREQDRVFLYFAGHGLTLGSGDGAMGYLMPSDGERDAAASTGVSMDELWRWFGLYQAKHVFLMADACYSGLVIKSRAGGLAPATADYARQVAARKVRMVLVAGAADEQALEYRGHGLLTAEFLDALRGPGDANADGLITTDELASYIKPRVAQTAQKLGSRQSPQTSRVGEGEFLFLSPKQLARQPASSGPSRGEPVAVESDPTQLYVQPATTPSRDERFLAWARLANALAASGERAKAEAVWRMVVAAFAKENLAKDGSAAAAAAAQASFQLLDPRYIAFLGERPAANLSTKATSQAVSKLFQQGRALYDDYLRLLDYRAPFWAVGALYRAAKVYQALARYVYRLPVPPELDGDERDVYLNMIDERMASVEAHVVQVLDQAAALSKERRLNNEWVPLVHKELALYKPAMPVVPVSGKPADKDRADLAPLRLEDLPDAERSVVKARTDRFAEPTRACYEAWLKTHPGRTLSVRIDYLWTPAGGVHVTAVDGADAELAACIRSKQHGTTGLPQRVRPVAFSRRFALQP